MSPISHMSTCAAPAPAAPTTMATAAISGTRRPTSRRRRGRRSPASAGPSDGATGSDARSPSAMRASPAGPTRGLLFEEHPGTLALRHGGLGDLGEGARERAAARGREPREGSEQPLLHGLGGAAQDGPAGGGERQLDAAGVGDGVPPRHEPALDEPPHDDGHRALVGVRAGGERAERIRGRGCELLEHEELRAADPGRLLRRPGREPQRPHEPPQRVHHRAHVLGLLAPSAVAPFHWDPYYDDAGRDAKRRRRFLLRSPRADAGPRPPSRRRARWARRPRRRGAPARGRLGRSGFDGAPGRARRARPRARAPPHGGPRRSRIARGGERRRPRARGAPRRRARYAALEALAREAGAARIVTGHTRDDQVETVLLRLLRGAGRGGLAGMRACRGRLWRPLLAVTRADVRRFLAERGLDFAVDRSNADLRHARNRVRRLLVPWLEAEFNPRLGPALAALAARLDDEERFLAAAARARAAALAAGPALAVAVGAEPPALGRRIVHTWLTAQTGRTATAHHVERILDLARDRARGPVAVPGPARVVREGEWLWCRPGREAPAEPFEAPIAPGERVGDPRGRWVLALSAPRPASAEDLAGAGPRRAVFDADALPPALRVRTPRPGDRVHLAHVGTRKLQDVLVDAHVPREARGGLALLVGGGTVLWVAGVVRSSAALLGPGTRRVVVGTLERA